MLASGAAYKAIETSREPVLTYNYPDEQRGLLPLLSYGPETGASSRAAKPERGERRFLVFLLVWHFSAQIASPYYSR